MNGNLTRRLVCLLVVLFIQGSLFADERTEDEIEQFVGNWKLHKQIVIGNELPDYVTRPFNYEFTKTEFIMTASDGKKKRVDKSKFKINPKAFPKQIDIIGKENGEDVTIRGIYKFEKDSLTICMGVDEKRTRPKKFESKMGSNTALVVLKLKR